MTTTLETGNQGEEIAAKHLSSKAYRIIDRNWRAGNLEIDIVALHGDILVFIEVKSRKAPHLIEPSIAVTRKKQRNLVRAANLYVKWKNKENECRFDIVTVIIEPSGERVEHIVNAFYPTL